MFPTKTKFSLKNNPLPSIKPAFDEHESDRRKENALEFVTGE